MIFLWRISFVSYDPNAWQWKVNTEHWHVLCRPQEIRALNASLRISRRVSSRNPSFLVKVGPVAREGPLVYHRGLRADGESTRTGRFTDGQGNFFAVTAVATAWVCHREKCRLFFSDCDKRAPPHRYTWVNAGTRVDVSISWLTNDRRPSSCTVTLQHAATVGQPVDKLMSKANWEMRHGPKERVCGAEAHSRILDNDSMWDLI